MNGLYQRVCAAQARREWQAAPMARPARFGKYCDCGKRTFERKVVNVAVRINGSNLCNSRICKVRLTAWEHSM